MAHNRFALDTNVMQKGDVICFQQDSKFVTFGQGLVKSFKAIVGCGSASSYKWNHVAIYTGHSQMAHACNAGTQEDVIPYDEAVYRIYRTRKDGFGEKICQVAKTWTRYSSNEGNFAIGKAVASTFYSATFGDSAHARAAFYHQHRNREGGPPGLSGDSGDKKSFYCSMWVCAVIQAVEGPPQCQSYIGMDARGSTPMDLVGYLKGNPTYWSVVAG